MPPEATAGRAAPRGSPWLSQWTYAHRGLHGPDATENSPAAFAAAIAAGLGIECDVHRSRDGRAIVFHDETLDRLTVECGPVAARSAAELGALALPAGGTIPSLRQVLDLVAARVPLLIELKSRRERPVAPLCRAVARELEGYAGPYAVMSFDPRVGQWFAGHAPDCLRGLVVSEHNSRTLGGALRRRWALWQARPHFLAYDVRDLPSPFAAGRRARGLPLLTWTVTGPTTAETAALHADASIAEGAGVAAALARVLRPARGERE